MHVIFYMKFVFEVRDLLNPATLKIKGGLKVRQHPKLGFYGEILSNSALKVLLEGHFIKNSVTASLINIKICRIKH